MTTRAVLVGAAMIALALAGCTEGSGAAAECAAHAERSNPDNPVATLHTSMGNIEAELYAHMTPITAQNFIDLAPRYVDVPFHRIISDFMMQGGDLSRSPAGGSSPNIEDEFHWMLRHDCEGQFSMANAGRGTGSSQFFVTFGETPHLDDRHTVFGQVIAGMDVVQKINDRAGSGSGTPTTAVTLEKVTIEGAVPAAVPGNVEVFTFVGAAALPADGGETGVLAVVENLEDHPVTVTVSASGDGHDVTLDGASFTLPARQRHTVAVNSLASPGAGDLVITATSENAATTTVEMEVGPAKGDAPTDGTSVSVDYIGATWDGRLFDTSIAEAAQYATANDLWFDLFQARPASSYSPATFPYGGTIPGFTRLVGDLNENEEGANRFGVDDAYGYRGCSPGQPCTGGLPMAFQAHLIEVS